MYKPHTIEQYKVQQFLDANFAMEYFLVSPLSRTALLLEDKTGDQIAFGFLDNKVQEILIPPPAKPEDVKKFLRDFRTLDPQPKLRSFEDITHWWLNHPNPLTYQQALCLSDELYRRFLSHPQLREEDCCRLAASGFVTEEEYQDIQLWFFDEGKNYCWLGPLGVDGTGNVYGLTIRYGKPDARKLKFYLLDDYYRYMNHTL